VYTISFKPTVFRAMKRLAQKISRSDWARLEQAIDSLSVDPRPYGVVKLSGTEFFRIRVGNYRVIYTIDDAGKSVVITKVARRSKRTYH